MKQLIKRCSLFSFMASSLIILSPLESSFEVVPNQMEEEVLTPSLQKVDTKKVRLSNGLEAIVISDPDTPKSGAALAVGVGNAHEPYDKVGLAHFVEHMLFLGTEKYPNEKEYHEFIQENGGINNAYTSSDRTVYMYEINNDQMPEALDRFGSFFSSPLFSASGLNRERLAVDQEFSHRAIQDNLRAYLVLLNQFKENHPLNNWRCGNRETLDKISRDELVSWYQTHYGSNRMKLVVYTSQPMDEAIRQVDQVFSQIQPAQTDLAPIERPILDPRNRGRWAYVKPLKEVRMLSLFWEIEPQYVHDLKYHTSDLVGDALSEENANSLATYLKEKGLIQSLGAGDLSFTSDHGVFQISMNLTEKGVLQRELVVEKVFEALQSLRQEGIPRYRFEEKVNVAKLKYQYQSRPNVFSYLSEASANLLEEPLETYPSKHLWPTEFSQERNQAFLESLKPNDAVYLLSAPENLLGISFDQIEQTAKVEYTTEEVSKAKLQAWSQVHPNPNLSVAPPNPYIPDHVAIVGQPHHTETPQLLVHNEKQITYFNGDNTYLVPECTYMVRIHSPAFLPSPQTEVSKDLYSLALMDGTAELQDQGQIAGLHHAIQFDSNFSLNMQVYGYSQKSKIYFQKLLEKAKMHRATEEEFKRYKEGLLTKYSNLVKKQPPLRQASEVVSSVIFKEHTSPLEKLEALQAMSYEDFQEFYSRAFEQVFIKSYFYGNLQKEDAKEVNEMLSSFFADSNLYPEKDLQRRSVLELGKDSPPQYMVKQTDVQGNAVCLMINHGEMTFKKMAALSVYANSVSTPFFDTLRTKQQTGYVVQSASQELERQLYSFFMVLSNSHSTRDLLARFELFNEEFLRVLNSQDYTEEKFQAIKTSIITELKQPPKSMIENGGREFKYAFDYQGDFLFHEKQIIALEALTYEDFLNFAYEQFGRHNSRRFAALINGKLTPENEFEYVPVQDFRDFKAQLTYTKADIIAEHDLEEAHGI